MRLIALVSAAAFAGETPDPRELVRRSALRDISEVEERRNYTYLRKIRQTEFDGVTPKKVEQKTFEVTVLYGRPYSRLIERDGKPLPAAEARKEQEKLDREMAKRSRESGRDRIGREAEERKEIEQEKKFRQEIVDAYDFRLLGEDLAGGVRCWLIQCDPRPGFRPQSRRGEALRKTKGKLWITREDLRWARAEVEFIDTYSLGWLLVRVSPGTKFLFEAKRAGEIWVPSRVYLRGQARLAAVKKFDLEIETLYENYRKFQTDSRIVGVTP